MRRWISLGGWCGPSLMLTKLGLRPAEEALPFDMVRCTFDGLVELTTNGFTSSASPTPVSVDCGDTVSGSYAFPRNALDGFFPMPQPAVQAKEATNEQSGEDSSGALLTFAPDPVSVWLLFRSQHACFTHFDLNNPEVQAEFQRRMKEWDLLLSSQARNASRSGAKNGTDSSSAGSSAAKYTGGVTFVRTTIAENPAEEIEMLPQFHNAVRRRTRGQLPFRTVLVVHDQAESTQPLCSFPSETSAHQSPCIVWNIKRQTTSPPTSVEAGAASPAVEKEPSLLDQCHDGYQTILTTMSKEQKWRSLDASLPSYAAYMKARGRPFTPYTELSRVAGIPAVRGTCTGFGSTFSAALGRCVHCGCTDGHAVPADRFDTQRTWTDADVDDLLMNYALHRCDAVAAVEATALAQQRGANETWLKLREMLSD